MRGHIAQFQLHSLALGHFVREFRVGRLEFARSGANLLLQTIAQPEKFRFGSFQARDLLFEMRVQRGDLACEQEGLQNLRRRRENDGEKIRVRSRLLECLRVVQLGHAQSEDARRRRERVQHDPGGPVRGGYDDRFLAPQRPCDRAILDQGDLLALVEIESSGRVAVNRPEAHFLVFRNDVEADGPDRNDRPDAQRRFLQDGFDGPHAVDAAREVADVHRHIEAFDDGTAFLQQVLQAAFQVGRCLFGGHSSSSFPRKSVRISVIWRDA